VRGPLQSDIHELYDAMSGPGTKERVLNDVLLGRSNADIRAIKSAYHTTFRRRLEDDVKGDLSLKTERHFLIVLGASRAEDSAPVVPQQIDADVQELYRATEGKVGTDEIMVCSILSTRNDNQIRAIAYAYEQKFRRKLEDVIKKVCLELPIHGSRYGLAAANSTTGIQRSHGRRIAVPAPPRGRQVYARCHAA
jgi:annexin A7/11